MPAPPGNAATPPEGGAPTGHEPRQLDTDGSHRVSQLPVEVRCSPPDRACIEVTARVAAGQQAIHETGCPEQGRRLLETARRIAVEHGYGSSADESPT